MTMKVIDVKSHERRLVARFRDEALALQPKDCCIIDIEGDLELARVKSAPYVWQEDLPPETVVFIHRIAKEEDYEKVRQNRKIELDAFRVALQKIREKELPMALTAVERTVDGKKMRFYFTADNRIDFRALVKDLASIYRTRIEMRQIGVRDRSKKIGGYGICGQELCCSRFLQKFEPITIRMAKEQNLALNPIKISGLCGRLMCCLTYEVDNYVDFRKSSPLLGTKVETELGEGIIIKHNYVNNTLSVRLEENKTVNLRLDQFKILSKSKAKDMGNVKSVSNNVPSIVG